MIRYIDTSVLVAYYLPEPLSERAERGLRRGGTPAISPLVELEFASVLARKVPRGNSLRPRRLRRSNSFARIRRKGCTAGSKSVPPTTIKRGAG